MVLFLPLLALFTLINVAANGFGMETTETEDPQGLMSSRHWFENPLFTLGDDKLQPTCTPKTIGAGDQFLTTNLGLLYTIRAVSKHIDADNTKLQLGSAGYLDQVLEDCQVDTVTAEMIKSDQGPAGHMAYWSWRSSTATAAASCNVTTPTARYTLHFDVSITSSELDMRLVVNDNYKTHASVWWGTRLLNNYLNGLKLVMAQADPGGGGSYTDPRLSYDTNTTGGS